MSSDSTELPVVPALGEFLVAAEIRETHSGVVLLMGDRALKFKKPVDLGFLDFTTVDRRREVCVREVELNRRLAPDVYEGVGDLVGPDGETLDHVVLMRRMPERRRLATLVRAGMDVEEQVRQVARALAAFHSRAERSAEISSDVTADSLEALWRSSFVQMADHADVVPASTEADIELLVGRYLAGRGPLLEQRSLTSVLDGHGDLMAEDIFCLDDGPRILDCLEFDDRLRHVDCVDDAAFLAMDLEHLGAARMAERFLDWYTEFSGDNAPPSLVEHYLGYRAFVRAKVACIRHAQGDAGAGSEGRAFATAALAHLQRSAVKLVVVGGAPATGKSTVAAGLADRLGLVVLSSDRVRKELEQLSPSEFAEAAPGEGIYSAESTHAVYLEMLRRAALLLELGESVVVDATWASEDRRAAARALAEACSADLVELRCDVDEHIADARLGARPTVSAAGTVSDATPAIAARLRAAFDPWTSAHGLSTAGDLAETISTALDVVCPRDGRIVRHPASVRRGRDSSRGP